jgi:hypothetical protein
MQDLRETTASALLISCAREPGLTVLAFDCVGGGGEVSPTLDGATRHIGDAPIMAPIRF